MSSSPPKASKSSPPTALPLPPPSGMNPAAVSSQTTVPGHLYPHLSTNPSQVQLALQQVYHYQQLLAAASRQQFLPTVETSDPPGTNSRRLPAAAVSGTTLQPGGQSGGLMIPTTTSSRITTIVGQDRYLQQPTEQPSVSSGMAAAFTQLGHSAGGAMSSSGRDPAGMLDVSKTSAAAATRHIPPSMSMNQFLHQQQDHLIAGSSSASSLFAAFGASPSIAAASSDPLPRPPRIVPTAVKPLRLGGQGAIFQQYPRLESLVEQRNSGAVARAPETEVGGYAAVPSRFSYPQFSLPIARSGGGSDTNRQQSAPVSNETSTSSVTAAAVSSAAGSSTAAYDIWWSAAASARSITGLEKQEHEPSSSSTTRPPKLSFGACGSLLPIVSAVPPAEQIKPSLNSREAITDHIDRLINQNDALMEATMPVPSKRRGKTHQQTLFQQRSSSLADSALSGNQARQQQQKLPKVKRPSLPVTVVYNPPTSSTTATTSTSALSGAAAVEAPFSSTNPIELNRQLLLQQAAKHLQQQRQHSESAVAETSFLQHQHAASAPQQQQQQRSKTVIKTGSAYHHFVDQHAVGWNPYSAGPSLSPIPESRPHYSSLSPSIAHAPPSTTTLHQTYPVQKASTSVGSIWKLPINRSLGTDRPDKQVEVEHFESSHITLQQQQKQSKPSSGHVFRTLPNLSRSCSVVNPESPVSSRKLPVIIQEANELLKVQPTSDLLLNVSPKALSQGSSSATMSPYANTPSISSSGSAVISKSTRQQHPLKKRILAEAKAAMKTEVGFECPSSSKVPRLETAVSLSKVSQDAQANTIVSNVVEVTQKGREEEKNTLKGSISVSEGRGFFRPRNFVPGELSITTVQTPSTVQQHQKIYESDVSLQPIIRSSSSSTTIPRPTFLCAQKLARPSAQVASDPKVSVYSHCDADLCSGFSPGARPVFRLSVEGRASFLLLKEYRTSNRPGCHRPGWTYTSAATENDATDTKVIHSSASRQRIQQSPTRTFHVASTVPDDKTPILVTSPPPLLRLEDHEISISPPPRLERSGFLLLPSSSSASSTNDPPFSSFPLLDKEKEAPAQPSPHSSSSSSIQLPQSSASSSSYSGRRRGNISSFPQQQQQQQHDSSSTYPKNCEPSSGSETRIGTGGISSAASAAATDSDKSSIPPTSRLLLFVASGKIMSLLSKMGTSKPRAERRQEMVSSMICEQNSKKPSMEQQKKNQRRSTGENQIVKFRSGRRQHVKSISLMKVNDDSMSDGQVTSGKGKKVSARKPLTELLRQ